MINPDFFVPSEFLGLNKNAGFQQLTNVGRSTYHSLQAKLRARIGRTFVGNVAYTLSRSMDTLSSDGGLVEHDPRRPENNFGPSDFDRPHRLTTSFILELPALSRQGLVRAVTGGWSVSGILTYQSGTPFSVIGNPTRNAFFAQVGRPRLSFAPGMSVDDAVGSGRVQDRLDAYFNVAAFADSLDQWGNTGRNILRGPSQVQLDLTLGRTVSLPSGQRLEIRWESVQRAQYSGLRQSRVHVRRQRGRHGRPHHVDDRRSTHHAAGGAVPVLDVHRSSRNRPGSSRDTRPAVLRFC